MAFLPEKIFLEETIANNYDLSNGVVNFTSSDLSKYTILSLQFNYTDIIGDNVFILEQSNDNINWAELSESYNLPILTGTFIIDKTSFTGKYLRINFNITFSGFITINLLAKK